MKVGDIVIPSSNWLGYAFYNPEQFGVGTIIGVGSTGKGSDKMYHIMWSGFGVFDSREYEFELEVISESR